MELTSGSHRIIAGLLSERTGQQLTEGRSWRIGTALAGVFRELGITNIDQLVCLLEGQRGGALSQQVVEALLNNETYFFRDRAMFDQLSRHVLPRIAERRRAAKTISILCAGCSTGQEALSLAMMFLDQKHRWAGWNIEINGFDISHDAISKARAGVYSQFEIQRGLSVTQMINHFSETPVGWEANDELRQMTRYRVHNVLEPLAGTGGYDLILSRNVLLYFDIETRRRAFTQLIGNMRDDGWMMLGAGETIVGQTDKLLPVKGGIGLYRSVQTDLEERRDRVA